MARCPGSPLNKKGQVELGSSPKLLTFSFQKELSFSRAVGLSAV